MKQRFVLLFIVVTIHLSAQTYEIRSRVSSPTVVSVDLRCTSVSGVPTTANFLVDLKFGLRWANTAGINLSNPSGSYFVTKSGGETVSGAYEFQSYYAGSTPFTFPANWVQDEWVTVMSVTVSGGTGSDLIEICPTSFDVTTDPNLNIDLADYLPVINGDAVMPVELASFTATAKGATVTLAWTTASEINTRSFEIEQSSGGAWKPVATVDAAGSSNAPKEYTYVDKVTFAANGAVSYRLKMVDNDGSFRYSAVAEASVAPTVFALEQNFPNPFNPATTIRYSLPSAAVVNLTVYDMLGRVVTNVVNETQSPGYYERRFGGLGLASGMYVYRLTAESNGTMLFTAVKKMLLTK